MPVTKLDAKTALIVIDLQTAILSAATVHPVADILKHTNLLSASFRKCGLPVVIVNVDAGAPGRTEQPRFVFPPNFAELAPELDCQPTDHKVTKRTWGAFMHTDLNDYLKKQNVTQVVIVGVATSAGVESTARQAHENGYNVTIATDAVTDRNAELHANSVTRVFPRISETGTTQEIIALLNA